MSKVTKRVVIVGGGSAGWITAGVIAAEHKANSPSGIQVILIESPDVQTVGVGEGTWPTMRKTLKKIGISENDLFKECDASFKQGAKFAKWVTGAEDDFYYHPFVLPHGYLETDLVIPWQKTQAKIPFADVVSFQGKICEQGLAPKQITTPEYAAVANYAYHLDAVKLGQFLRKHCIEKLGVQHIIDHVTQVNSAHDGDIASILTNEHGSVEGDLFIDCTGKASLLLGQHYQIPFICKKGILFNDSALAVHVPYPDEDSPIAPHTNSTAQSAGWIWDIGLPTRRGVGYTYSSKHISDEDAEVELRKYIEDSTSKNIVDSLMVRKITIKPGHREKFWHKNCVAVGIAAGFLEPLEASALVLIELAAEKISNDLPATRDVMDIVAKRYNKQFLYRWNRIVEFLKLHYILTKRTDSAYWIDNCKEETIPDSLLELLVLWRHHPPCPDDFIHINEVFPSASWQYVLYGMGFETQARSTTRKSVNTEAAQRLFSENKAITNKYLSALPVNRELIDKIKKYGMKKV
ncbi:MAG TPA: tryptophan halogenase [Colwellia sp.]|nr:tryptophan halogenase [Colwellia sp.]|tara:strand:- start:1314 stop:2873 length:1560 start_codon:yes stop_codon:yes gene_type:complete